MKLIVVTGGSGFIGSNLIELLLKKTNYKIISLDNYSTGLTKNHIKNPNVKYLRGDTENISKHLSSYRKNIVAIFHFAEFSRIAQSFEKINLCFKSNILGTLETVNFCLSNKIKIIYSATSASLGNMGDDQNLSPYAFTKANNMNLIINYNNWFKLRYEIVYFYNVYGPRQIKNSFMSAVIGIFENCYEKNIPFPVVKPGTQTRKFTHVQDTVEACFYAWKRNKNEHYSISTRRSYTIMQVAKFFGKKIKYIKQRRGERFESSVVQKIRSLKINNLYGKIDLKDYIFNYKKSI